MVPDSAPQNGRRLPLDALLGLTSLPGHPDATLLACIDRYLYLRDAHLGHAGTPRRGCDPAAVEAVRDLDALEAEIGRIPACTALGARAKLELELDLMPKGGTAYAIPTSALRDFLAAMDAETVAGPRRG